MIFVFVLFIVTPRLLKLEQLAMIPVILLRSTLHTCFFVPLKSLHEQFAVSFLP